MNLLDFFNKIENIFQNKTKQELEKFIIEIARKLPTDKRNDFLNKLESSNDINILEDEKNELSKNVKNIITILDKINDDKIYLSCNEFYDDEDDDYNTEYFDKNNICKDIKQAITLFYKCYDLLEYNLGFQLGKKLISLKTSLHYDYGDIDELSLSDLHYKDLVTINIKEFVVLFLYLSYLELPILDKVSQIYNVINEYSSYKIKLEDIMQIADLPQFDLFLSCWITYLGNMNSSLSQSLLEEALDYTSDEILLYSAEIFVNNHPELYKKYLERKIKSNQLEGLYQIGLKAIKKINKKCVIRSQIARLMFNLTDNNDEKDYCLFEIFNSNTNLTNYLHLKRNIYNYENYNQKINEICNNLIIEEQYCPSIIYFEKNIYLAENKVNNITKNLLLFFQGDFKTILNKNMNIQYALGWSNTFMKVGIALFLLLLYNHETLNYGTEAMLDIFYVQLINEDNVMKKNDLLQIFIEWKKTIILSHQEKNDILLKFDQLIKMRLKGIIDNSKRDYYHECASFIAALGEVKESLQLVNSKQTIFKEYSEMYPKYRSFQKELKNFGMF